MPISHITECCGIEVPAEYRYCPKCGQEYRAVETVSAPINTTGGTYIKTGMGWVRVASDYPYYWSSHGTGMPEVAGEVMSDISHQFRILIAVFLGFAVVFILVMNDVLAVLQQIRTSLQLLAGG